MNKTLIIIILFLLSCNNENINEPKVLTPVQKGKDAL